MNPKQQAFLKLYLGRDASYHGNATRSYVKAYGCTNERVAQTSGSRLLTKPEIAHAVAGYRKKAGDQIEVDAAFVLQQSVRIYDRAMGDEGVDVDHIDKHGELVTCSVREHMPAIAVKALELIGKHTTVQAFQENVEHTHTHRLEQALQARQKAVERKALSSPAIEEHTTVINNKAQAPEIDAPQKTMPSDGGQSNPPGQTRKTSHASAGAAGE
jgi:phage terminase small subunit